MFADCLKSGVNIFTVPFATTALIDNLVIVGQSKGNSNPADYDHHLNVGIMLPRAEFMNVNNVQFINLKGAAFFACSTCENVC